MHHLWTVYLKDGSCYSAAALVASVNPTDGCVSVAMLSSGQVKVVERSQIARIHFSSGE